MVAIKTMVYFDLEATGLKSSGKPRISEISLVAVNVQDLPDLQMRIQNLLENLKFEDKTSKVEQLVPRVMNKLTLCVYPMAAIMPVVSSITGLDNYNLTDQARFDKNTVSLLNSFLSRLPSPVCLVAHNGDMYDYPLLKAELEKIGEEIGSEILCVDSYVGIKEIFKRRADALGAEQALKREMERKLVDKEIEAVTELLYAGEFETEMDIDTFTPTQVSKKRQVLISSSDLFKMSKISKLENESTPRRSKNTLLRSQNPSKMKQVSCSEIFKSRKKLNFSSSSTPTSFSLGNLHNHLLGCFPSQAHGAEADCLALLRTTAVLGKEWLDWVEDNCYVFTDCRRMWGRGGVVN